MIKIIKNLFTTPEEVYNSNVEIKIEDPVKSNTELFDAAVQKVIKTEQRKAVRVAMMKVAFGEERYDQSIAAIEKFSGREITSDEKTMEIIKSEFPAVILTREQYSHRRIDLDFRIEDFIHAVVGE